MNYAISTKFIGPTNYRGARVKAYTPTGKSITVAWDHEKNSIENHQRAAAECFKRFFLNESPDRVPWVHSTHSVYGINGYVCLVQAISADQAVNY